MTRRTLLFPLLAAVAFGASNWSISDQERFLATAPIVEQHRVDKGSTGSLKVTLGDGKRRHDAHVTTIDVYQPLWKGKDGSEEREFRDSWKFNVAAWRLAKRLKLENMVPASVERQFEGKPASIEWWIDGIMMDEKERKAKNIEPPDPVAWRRQMDIIRVFDQLIYNMDRNRENLLITHDWHAWMIDHTRAFRTHHTLRNPAAITVCEPELLSALKSLKRDRLVHDLVPYVSEDAIDALLARRDLIVTLLEEHMNSHRGAETQSR